jgi:hypothetical protein
MAVTTKHLIIQKKDYFLSKNFKENPILFKVVKEKSGSYSQIAFTMLHKVLEIY